MGNVQEGIRKIIADPGCVAAVDYFVRNAREGAVERVKAALGEVQYSLERIPTADWVAEQVRFGTKLKAQAALVAQGSPAWPGALLGDSGYNPGDSGEAELPGAIRLVQKAIRDDAGYRQGWLANIAMAFHDEWYRTLPHNGGNPPGADLIHGIANQAARNFLDLFTRDGHEE